MCKPIFVEVTDLGSNCKAFVDIQKIKSIWPLARGTYLFDTQSFNFFKMKKINTGYSVKESYEEVKQLIEKAIKEST